MEEALKKKNARLAAAKARKEKKLEEEKLAFEKKMAALEESGDPGAGAPFEESPELKALGAKVGFFAKARNDLKKKMGQIEQNHDHNQRKIEKKAKEHEKEKALLTKAKAAGE